MIVLDSSAVIAILEGEPEQFEFLRVVSDADRRIMSAINYQETAQVVFARRGVSGLQALDELLKDIGAEIVNYDESLSRTAIAAFQRFGKGINAQARLNLGDCAAYALSKQTGAPLLFKGNDFNATDVRRCVSP